jgi:hypothetical protein
LEADDRFSIEIEPGRRWIEAGVASWDPGDGACLSVRHHVLKADGGFDPISSGEIPAEHLGQMVDVLRKYLQHR